MLTELCGFVTGLKGGVAVCSVCLPDRRAYLEIPLIYFSGQGKPRYGDKVKISVDRAAAGGVSVCVVPPDVVCPSEEAMDAVQYFERLEQQGDTHE